MSATGQWDAVGAGIEGAWLITLHGGKYDHADGSDIASFNFPRGRQLCLPSKFVLVDETAFRELVRKADATP